MFIGSAAFISLLIAFGFGLVFIVLGIGEIFGKRFISGLSVIVTTLVMCGGCYWFNFYRYEKVEKMANVVKSDHDIIKLPGYIPVDITCYGTECVTYFRCLDPKTGNEKEVKLFVDGTGKITPLMDILNTEYKVGYDLYVKRLNGKMFIQLIEIPMDGFKHWISWIGNRGKIIIFGEKSEK